VCWDRKNLERLLKSYSRLDVYYDPRSAKFNFEIIERETENCQ